MFATPAQSDSTQPENEGKDRVENNEEITGQKRSGNENGGILYGFVVRGGILE